MIRAVLLDIEGTTTRVSFVTDVLFPYARARLDAWVSAHPEAPEVRATRELASEPHATPAEVAAILHRWMDEDRKATPLKAIQGALWAEGYADGTLVSHVYPDVPTALARWRGRGLVLAVYSSGSVPAQQLLFGHTVAGDLSGLFSGWFDTTVGPKREGASYTRIAAGLGVAPEEILFLTDTPAEADAAGTAGVHALLLQRDGGPYATFDDVERILG